MSVEAQRQVRIVNDNGLHARPSYAIVTAANLFASEFWVSCDGNRVNGKSILELMTLCAPHGATLELEARGRDAEELVARVAVLIESGFGELA